MIHHVSFGVRNPDRVAHVLAGLMDAAALRAPTPPFPHGAWFVACGDAQGSVLEILPATSVFDPDAPLGVRQRPATSEPLTTHVLVSAAVSAEAIRDVAAREAWRTEEVETGLFKVVKLWIDGNVLVEFLAKGEADRYVGTFGAPGMPALERRLRELEAEASRVLSRKLPQAVLVQALGPYPAPPGGDSGLLHEL